MNNPPLGHITTFGGHPVSCAAALANLNILAEGDLIQQVAVKEKLFHELLDDVPGVLELRSSGLMMALELGSPKRLHEVVDYCIAHGIIVDWFLFRETAMRIAPPLIISEEEIRFAAGVIKEALNWEKP